jgi:hypothetical protein
MKTLLYNISYLSIFFGIILLVIYFTTINNSNKCIIQKPVYEKPYDDNYNKFMVRKYKNAPSIYDLRPNTIYKKMFSEPDLILGYQSFDINENNTRAYDKLYI